MAMAATAAKREMLVRQRAIPEDDPLWQAAMRAPIDHGPVPEEEQHAVEEAIRVGRFVDGESVSAEIAFLTSPS